MGLAGLIAIKDLMELSGAEPTPPGLDARQREAFVAAMSAGVVRRPEAEETELSTFFFLGLLL